MTAAVEARERAEFDVEIRAETSPLTQEERRRALRDFDIVVPTLGDAFDAATFADVQEPRCRLLANFGVGFNHIDVAAAKAAGIAVSNTPGAVTDATADIAMTLMLMTARRAGEGERLVRSGAWQGWHPTQMLGLHLTGKHVGIVALAVLARLSRWRCHYGFAMEVSCLARSNKTPDFPVTRANSLVELAASVDVLVLAVPGGAETRHLITAEVLGAMRSQRC